MIHKKIMDRIYQDLNTFLVDEVPIDDPSRAFLVKLGPLQGDPDPDEARIFITLHENDPDTFISGTVTSFDGKWVDEVDEMEIGGPTVTTTWIRRFVLKAMLLLEATGEDEDDAREYASTLRSRIERRLLAISFSGVKDDGEYVSEPIREVLGEMRQGGGPPDSFAFRIKIRFSLKTTG